MKVLCLIAAFLADGSFTVTEKPMESIEECLAWKHQQEFHYAVRPVVGLQYMCLAFWEA